MKTWTALTAAAIVAAAGIALAGNPSSNKPSNPNTPSSNWGAQSPQQATKNLTDTIFAAPNFKTFSKALKQTNLVNTFNQQGSFTIFVPSDEAWAKLPPGTVEELLKPQNQDKLANIIKYHALPNQVRFRDLSRMRESSQTLLGQTFSIRNQDGTVQIGSDPRLMATIVQSDVYCTNGVIHVINGVMMPRE